MFPAWSLGLAPVNLLRGWTHFLPDEKQPAPGSCPKRGRLRSCQLSSSAPQANLRQATTGEELSPQGESFLLTSWPPEWWRGAGVTTAEREGGPLLGVLF